MNLQLFRQIKNRIGHLSLRAKVLLITGTVLVSLILTAGIGVDFLIRESFERLERDWIRGNALRIEKLFTLEADSMQRITHDYAVWTDTYDFVRTSDPAYIKVNINLDVFKNLQIYGTFIYYPDGKRKTGIILNSDGVSLAGAGDEWDQALGSIARKVVSGKTPLLNGLIKNRDDLFIISSHTILRYEGDGVPSGCLIHVRKVDSAFLQRFSDTAGITINLADIPPDKASSLAEVQGSGNYFICTEQEIVHLNIVLRDINGRDAGVVVSHLGRDINRESRRARVMFYVVLGLVLIVSGFLAHYLINRLVLARLEKMLKEVRNVRETLDLSKRLEVREWDELDDLAGGINLMLDAIEEQKAYRDKAESEKEAMQEYMLQLKKMEAMGTLAGGIAHDFNNMLVSILGSAGLLRNDIPGGSPLLEYVDIIEKSGQNAGALVRQMLTLGKGYTSLKIYFSVGQTINDMLSLVKITLPENIYLNLHSSEKDDLIYADITQFQQLIVNMVTNASHAMAGRSRGDIDIYVRGVILPSEGSRPETGSLAEGRYMQIEITDSGEGIPPDIRDKIFEPFFSTKPVGSGTGLGLSVVYQFVIANGGSIGVESDPGRGTSFFMHFPAVVERRRVIPRPDGAEIGILVVDDDPLVRRTIVAGLKRVGYLVFDAGSGQSALNIIDESAEDIQLIITDQMMPGMSGNELRKRVASLCPGLPVILMSGYTSGLDDKDDKNSGFARILMKPITIDQLDKIINEVLNTPL